MDVNWALIGTDWIINIQAGLTDWMVTVFKGFSFLGTEEAYMVVLIAIWAINYSLAIQVGFMLMVNNPINTALKMMFAFPRPNWVDPLIKGFGKAEIGFGLPSGHSQIPVAFYGLLATQMKKKTVKWGIWIVIFLIGISRLFLGMHFPLDVLVGWAIGAIFLASYIIYKDRVTNWIFAKTYKQQILITFLFSIFLLSLPALVAASNGNYVIPADWQTNAQANFSEIILAPFHFNSSISAAATLFGMGAGGFWLRNRGGYQNTDEKDKQFYIFVIGLAGVLAIKIGLGAIFPSSENLLGYSLRFLRYALMGIWIGGWAPAWLIKKGWGLKKNE